VTLHLRNGTLVAQRPWSEADLAEACRLRQDHQSASVIAKKLGRSRNSVIGALWRAKEPRVLENQFGAGFWARAEPAPRNDIPMRFSEQRHVP